LTDESKGCTTDCAGGDLGASRMNDWRTRSSKL
jgi:hypothetical protein